MPFVYITGISGTGKSTICQELKKRGYEAHDTDENGLTTWFNVHTGQEVERPDAIKDRTAAWYAEHQWRMPRERVLPLAARAKTKLVFLCGAVINDDEVRDLFGKIICLTLREADLKHRLLTRTTNDFGKAPAELADVLKRNQPEEEEYRQLGAVMLDASQPLDKLVVEVLSYGEGG